MAKQKRLAPTVTSPAKMGEEMAHPAANASQSPNVKYQARGGAKGGPEAATAGGRSGRLLPQSEKERLGAKWAPQMLMSAPQAPEAGLTGRNVRVLPSAIGNRDFYLKRMYGQSPDFG